MMYEADEIQNVMGRSYGIGDDIDEAELEAEFDALGNTLVLLSKLIFVSRRRLSCRQRCFVFG